MPPPRTPRPCCQPKPSTRSVPSLSVRPIRQAILVVPMSSTPNGPERPYRGRAGSSGSARSAAARGATCRSCWLLRRRRRVGRGRTTAIGQAACRSRQAGGRAARGPAELHQPIERRRLVALRQHHVGAAVKSQVPAPLADAHGGDHALLQLGPIGQRIDQRRGSSLARQARPPAAAGGTRATFSSATIWPSRSISTNLPWFCQIANGRRLLQTTRRRCRAAAARPWRVPPRTGSRSAARACSSEKPRIGSPLADAKRGAQQRLRRVGAALDHHVVTRKPAKRGGTTEPLAQRGERAAGRCRAQNDTRRAERHAIANATQPAGRSRRFCGAAAASQPAGRSLTELRGPRVTRGMPRSPPSRRRAAGSSCRDAPPAPAAARSASGRAAC